VTDVDLSRAPREAVQDFLENRAAPSEAEKPPRGRGRRARINEHHARMLERER